MKKYINIAIALLCFLNITIWTNYFAWEDSSDLEINFLDVGQGDSLLIKTPENNLILIDGGPKSNVMSELSKTLPFLAREIDVVISTHPDSDHIEGLSSVLQTYNTEYYFINKVKKDSEVFLSNLEVVKDSNVKNYSLHANNDFIIDEVKFDVLWPDQTAKITTPDPNDNSVSILISYKNFTFLTLGDLDSEFEEYIVGKNKIDDIDVLKVSHHGSKFSTSDSFIKSIKPEYAVISVGKNSYGHPTPQVINILNNNSVNFYRTDLNSTIKLTTNGTDYKFDPSYE